MRPRNDINGTRFLLIVIYSGCSLVVFLNTDIGTFAKAATTRVIYITILLEGCYYVLLFLESGDDECHNLRSKLQTAAVETICGRVSQFQFEVAIFRK